MIPCNERKIPLAVGATNGIKGTENCYTSSTLILSYPNDKRKGIFMSYAIYLRKSREDREAEAHGEGETLSRHRTTLFELAKSRLLPVGAVYEEIASGETIAARPKMQQLLEEVEVGQWEGVLVMEVERLARGNGIDQGLVSQAFQSSGTKIITPYKTYDPSNEMDEDYFEFGLFMSRREFKTINRRLNAGRISSVKEGKWLGGPEPYGYRRYKLPNEKGWSLEIVPEQAEVIQRVFRMYLDGVGTHAIATKLVSEGCIRPNGTGWEPQKVQRLLKNPVYCGYVKWGQHKQQKIIKDGKVTRRFHVEKDYLKIKGRHEAIISEEDWNLAQQKLAETPGVPVPGNKEFRNPFQGLMYCRGCGHRMQRQTTRQKLASGEVRQYDLLFCRCHSCDMAASQIYIVEEAVLETLRNMVCGYKVDLSKPDAANQERLDILHSEIDSVNREISKTNDQLQKAFELVEQEIYTAAQFLERRNELLTRTESLNSRLNRLEQELEDAETAASMQECMIPLMESAIEAYPKAQTAEEKKNILQSVITRIDYEKHPEPGKKKQDWPIILTIHPRIPRRGKS